MSKSKSLEIFQTVLEFLLRFVKGDAIKGWKTIIFNITVALGVFLEKMEIVSIVESTCELITSIQNASGWVVSCDLGFVETAYIMTTVIVNIILRAFTNSGVFDSVSVDELKAENARLKIKAGE